MFKKSVVAALITSASLASSLTFAFDVKPYVFGNIGGAKVDLDQVEGELNDAAEIIGEAGGSSSTDVDDTSLAFSIGVGAQLHRNFALELGYYDLGSYEANASASYSDDFLSLDGDAKGEAEASGYGLQGVVLIPFSNSFTGTISVGVARIKTEVDLDYSYSYEETTGYTETGSESFNESSNDTVGTFGIGARYDISNSVALRADYVYFDEVGDKETTGESSIDMLTVGLNYNF